MRRGQARRPRGRAVWQAGDIEVEFIYVRPKAFFGHQQVWVSRWRRVAVTDPERTALDLLARPDLFGGMGAALELLEAALPRLNIETLVNYALRLEVGAVIKRLGWALEQMDVVPEALEPLQAYPVRTDYRLDPQKPATGDRSARWRVIENLETSAHACCLS
jgi:predicted transcriptional regulator of viral defense system